MSEEIQRDEFILPGDLGTVNIGGNKSKITKMFSIKDAHTITLSEVVDHCLNGIPQTEDADFEVIQPKQLPEENPEAKRLRLWKYINDNLNFYELKSKV